MTAARIPSRRPASTARTAVTAATRAAPGVRSARATALQFMKSISNVKTEANPDARFDRRASAEALARNVTFRDPLLKLEGRDQLLRLLKVYNDPDLKPQYDFQILGQKGDVVQAVWKTEYKFNGWDRYPVKNDLKLDLKVKDGKIVSIRQSYDADRLADQTVRAVVPLMPRGVARRAMSAALRVAMRTQHDD